MKGFDPKFKKVGKIVPKNKIAFGLKPATNNPSIKNESPDIKY